MVKRLIPTLQMLATVYLLVSENSYTQNGLLLRQNQLLLVLLCLKSYPIYSFLSIHFNIRSQLACDIVNLYGPVGLLH